MTFKGILVLSLAVIRLLARSAGALEESFSLLPCAPEERQRRQREEQHRQESGSNESCVHRGTDQIELHTDLAGDDQETERGRL